MLLLGPFVGDESSGESPPYNPERIFWKCAYLRNKSKVSAALISPRREFLKCCFLDVPQLEGIAL